MTEKQLQALTSWLIENIFRNPDIMFDDAIWNQEIELYGATFDMIDIIASLHNLLYEAITGTKYDYMFHWCNKIGSDCIDDVFNSLLLHAADEEKKERKENDD